ncbi:MAG TPA: DUF1080 domain-containing protein [Candidatus Hydrogenedentes bacterium]|nr:DUF1080 domain-containing protein [Candidatus Hydrogenedentota bacterium]
MKRTFFLLTLLFLTAGMVAAVEDDDMIMGNYHGGFTTAAWANRYIRAQVVAQSKTAHRIVLFVGENETDAARVETAGKVEDGVAVFGDVLDLGKWGKYDFAARIENETMTGALTTEKQRGQQVAFELKRVFITPPSLGMAPPEGAIMLFDGTSFALWERTPLHWCMRDDGSMEVCNSSLKTIEEYGSGLYHVEFQTPFMPTARGQSRGNSGVYVLGRYEVQVLDSFGLEPADNFCGGLYSLATPIADAALPPKQWQTYDITFQAPKFDENGAKISNAIIHVLHNGIVIHDNAELDSGTPGGVSEQEASTGPLLLQNHGDRVRYRNIWFKPAE